MTTPFVCATASMRWGSDDGATASGAKQYPGRPHGRRTCPRQAAMNQSPLHEHRRSLDRRFRDVPARCRRQGHGQRSGEPSRPPAASVARGDSAGHPCPAREIARGDRPQGRTAVAREPTEVDARGERGQDRASVLDDVSPRADTLVAARRPSQSTRSQHCNPSDCHPRRPRSRRRSRDSIALRRSALGACPQPRPATSPQTAIHYTHSVLIPERWACVGGANSATRRRSHKTSAIWRKLAW